MSWKYSVPVPCRIGDKVYSIIGEKVNSFVVDGYRIGEDGTYLVAEDVFIKADNIGKYYFFDEKAANDAFQRKRDGGAKNG